MKKKLRKEMRRRRDAVPREERQTKSRRIAAHILHSEAYRRAERIFSYLSFGSEVETGFLLERAWQDGKMVAVPKTEAGGRMYFLPIRSMEECEVGSFGIKEPMGDREKERIPERGDLFLVPGLAFDKMGNRLGYGGGYYDRYFEAYREKEFRKTGLAFSFQKTEEALPTEKTDIPLDDMVTENGWEEWRNEQHD